MDSGVSGKSSSLNHPRRRCLSILAIIAYLCSGLLIVVVNKIIVRDHGLHTPALVSSTGALFTAAVTRFLVFLGKVHVKPVGNRPWEFAFRRALPVGVCAAGSLCFGNMSYIYLDAGFVQMLKAGTPALLLLVLACLRVEAISLRLASLAMCMVGGSALASAQQPHATAIGLAVQLFSQLCEVLQCTAVQVFLQQLGFEAWDAGYYLAPAVAACCLLPSLVLEWPHVIVNEQISVLYEQVPLLLASGSIGIVVNFSSLLVIKFTSSLFAKLLVIARSSALVLIFIALGEEFTWLQVIGYLITLCAFAGYSIVKAREIDQQDRQLPLQEESCNEDGELAAARSSDEDIDLLKSMNSSQQLDADRPPPSSFDATSLMFWFAISVVIAGGYQAAVVGELESGSRCSLCFRELGPARHKSASSRGVPPSPYLGPIAADTSSTRHVGVGTLKAGSLGTLPSSVAGIHSPGAISVQSPAKVLHLADGRFLLHQDGSVVLEARQPKSLLSSTWLITSRQFGTVHLQALNTEGDISWLSCNLTLTAEDSKACLLWMTAAHWEHWSAEATVGQYILRRHGGEGLFLAAGDAGLTWASRASAFHVADWVPEECSLIGMTPSPHGYPEAMNEVTFTMTTFFHVYARSVMFRQALSSVFMFLKERDFYIREFIVINDWFKGNSLNFNGTFTGPRVEETREEMLAFFPGCRGMSVELAHRRGKGAKCSFVFKGPDSQGQSNSLNILLDLMVTKFWIQFSDDHVFYQAVYMSRMLAPMFDHPESCWYRDHRLATTSTSTLTTSTITEVTTVTVASTSTTTTKPLQHGVAGAVWSRGRLPGIVPPTAAGARRVVDSRPEGLRASTFPGIAKRGGLAGALAQQSTLGHPPATVDESAETGRRLKFDAEAPPAPAAYSAAPTGAPPGGVAGAFASWELPKPRECTVVAGVRLEGSPLLSPFSNTFEIEQYTVPNVLYNRSYVRALLAHGGFDDDKHHDWGDWQHVKAVPWPMFSLRPGLHNLTYIKSLEAPLFYDGRPGRFSEDPNITRWRDGGRTYKFHWDFELEFAVRWARGGVKMASVSPGACMRDVSNGINSFERSFQNR